MAISNKDKIASVVDAYESATAIKNKISKIHKELEKIVLSGDASSITDDQLKKLASSLDEINTAMSK